MYSWRVPLAVGGDLSITARHYIGSLGAENGPVFHYSWMRCKSMLLVFLQYGVWMALIPFLFLSANRNRGGWKILVPVLSVTAAANLAVSLPLFRNQQEITVLVAVLNALTLVSGIMYLLSHVLAEQGMKRYMLIFLPVIVAVSVCMSLVYVLADFGEMGGAFLATFAMTLPVFFGGLIGGRRTALKKWSKLRLCLHTALWYLLLSSAGFALVSLVHLKVEPTFHISDAVGLTILGGPAAAIVISIIALPFLVLILSTPVYMERLGKIFPPLPEKRTEQ